MKYDPAQLQGIEAAIWAAAWCGCPHRTEVFRDSDLWQHAWSELSRFREEWLRRAENGEFSYIAKEEQ